MVIRLSSLANGICATPHHSDFTTAHPGCKRPLTSRRHFRDAVKLLETNTMSFTEMPPEEIAQWLPCSSVMHWPGYDTKVISRKLDGRDIIIQLWKGYCPSYLPGQVGGVGAEVGIYHSSFNPFLWYPDYQHKKSISFKLHYPNSANTLFFSASAKTCWWRHKWMTEASYLTYKANHSSAPNNPTKYKLSYRIVGSNDTITGIW